MDIESQIRERRNPKNRVKVAVRARPMISRQLVSHDRICIEAPNNQQIIIGNDRSFKFDRVFKETSSQSEVYEQCIKDLVLGCFEGYNAAVLAYGQTGSGKTYTMGTNTTMECSQEGIVPKVINELFSEIEKRKAEAEFTVKASFLEIYNEQIIDLLENQRTGLKMKENNVSIREQKDGSISIQGVAEEYVTESAGMLALLDRGSINRTTAATLMNDSSSRSHAIFTVFVEQYPHQQTEEGFITAKFFFVDLAGSERVKKTGTSGATMKEGININLGLLELGNVISALSSDKKQTQFISYRNSKLTRILQDSLGGNSNTYMIACISPAQSNYEQSLNTLKYASKAMNIKNKPVVNRDPHSAVLNQLRQRIKQLEDENGKLKDLLKGEGINFDFCIGQSKSQNEEQLKKLNLDMTVMKKTNQKLFLQLKEYKKKKSQLQIQNYEIQRQRDILNSIVDQFKANHPQFQIEVDELYNKQNIPLIESYLTKIQNMQTELHEKDKINNQLQIQYTKLHQITERNEQILLKKNQSLYKIAKQNKDLRKLITDLKQEIFKVSNVDEEQQDDYLEEMSIINQILQDQDNLEQDQTLNRQISAFSRRQQYTKSELKSVEEIINQRENALREMTQLQMDCQKELILEMKEQYHQKINELEKEKRQLMNQQRNEISSHTTQKLANKIDSLEVELRQYRGKAKEQKQMETKVNNQNNTIKNLGNQLKNFKMQKIELNRRLKEDKQTFQKFKQKRTQQLMVAKKDNMKKDVQIRKLTHENKKKAMVALKRADEIKKIKKVNETLKKLFRPVRKNMSRLSLRSERGTTKREKEEMVPIPAKQIEQLVTECLRNMLLKIDRDFDLIKYSNKCEEINKQLDSLVREQSTLSLKIQQFNLQYDQFDFDNIDKQIERQARNSQMKAHLLELKDAISTLEQNFQFCEKKYAQLLEDCETKYQYSYETAILYNSKYDDINSFRQILRSFIHAFHPILIQNYELKVELEQVHIRNNSLLTEIQQLKQNIIKMNLQHQERISQLREQMMLKLYEESFEDNKQADMQKSSNVSTNVPQKLTNNQRKMFEKKIDEMTKKNNKLLVDNETWRRKCEVVTEKYNNIRSVFNKDKFVGLGNKQQQNNINHPNYTGIKDNRKLPAQTPASYQVKIGNHNSNMIDQLNSMAEQLQSARAAKKNFNIRDDVYGAERSNCDTPIIQTRRDFNRYKWQNVGTIEAHATPVLCIKNHGNTMVSSASRSIRIWDLQYNSLVSDIVNNNLNYLNYFVRSLAIHPQKQLLAAACDKLVTLWDLRQATAEGVIRGHKEQVRCLHIVDNYLFTAGKGLSNSDSLLVWDLRYIKFNNPTDSKERNQDIFSMTSYKNILYYGSRDHQVRRMNIDTLQTLTTFQPPHMDTVTGLATSKGYLISGSKDKNLRLWSLDNSIYNLKSTVHASNDHINCVEGDPYHPLFYAGDRTGQVKVGSIIKEKIEFVGGFAHSQPVHTICSLQTRNRCIATGSADKSIKLWQPTTETFHQIQANLC